MLQKTPKPKRKLPKLKSNCSFRIESQSGYKNIIGIDEVGRGCLAGPVVAAGVVFSPEFWKSEDKELALINDSKKLSPKRREELSEYIHKNAEAVEICYVSETEIDQINILQATWKAAREVLQRINKKVNPIELVLVDGSHFIPAVKLKQKPIIGGDSISKSIAAASIVAKVHRDRFMAEMSKKYSAYSFEQNKGYGTKVHREAIMRVGSCKIHRKTFLRNIEAPHMETIQLGQDGETLVCEYLTRHGFKILEKNWKVKGGEIDIIAEKKGLLHFVEVRTRSRTTDVEMMFSPKKQKQFQKCVELYFLYNPKMNERTFHLHFMRVTEGKIQPFWDVFKF